MMVLTADGIAVIKGFKYSGIHFDRKILLLYDVGVPVTYSLHHPFSKCILHRGVDNIHHPLLWELVPFFLHGQVLEAEGVFQDKGLDLLHAQGFILWNGDMLDVVTCNESLLA